MSDKMRQEFEVWASTMKSCLKKYNGEYMNPFVEHAWQAWQASRAAMVVELPKEECETMHAGAVCAALDKAGVKYE